MHRAMMVGLSGTFIVCLFCVFPHYRNNTYSAIRWFYMCSDVFKQRRTSQDRWTNGLGACWSSFIRLLQWAFLNILSFHFNMETNFCVQRLNKCQNKCIDFLINIHFREHSWRLCIFLASTLSLAATYFKRHNKTLIFLCYLFW